MRIVFVALLSFFSIAPYAFPQGIDAPPPPPPPMREEAVAGLPRDIAIVSGNATVEMTPDQVSFNISVTTDGKDIRKIVEENNAKVTRILTELKRRGVRAEEVQTSEFSLRSPRDSDESADGYRVSNEIGVTRRTTAEAGDVIMAVVDAGANGIEGPRFSVSDEKIVQDRCVELAFGDARRKATKLAALSGRRLGKVLAVTDGSSSPFELKSRYGVVGDVLGGLSLEAGVHVVECGVTVAFRLDDL